MPTKEQNLYKKIKKHLENFRQDFFVERIENCVGAGIPDVHLMIKNRGSVFVELKSPRVAKRDTTKICDYGANRNQINWHLKAAEMGVQSWFLIQPNERFAPIYLVSGSNAKIVNDLTPLDFTQPKDGLFVFHDWYAVFKQIRNSLK